MREGENPQCGYVRFRGVGLRRSTAEQAEQRDLSPAEVGEGRMRTKENIALSNTSPIQSGQRVSQGWNGVWKLVNRFGVAVGLARFRQP